MHRLRYIKRWTGHLTDIPNSFSNTWEIIEVLVLPNILTNPFTELWEKILKNAFDWSLFLFLHLCLSAFLYLSIYLSLSLLHRGGVWNINHATYVYKYFSRISRMIPINQHNLKPLPTSPYCWMILLIKIWMDAPTTPPPNDSTCLVPESVHE